MAVNEKNFADGEVLGAPTGIRTREKSILINL